MRLFGCDISLCFTEVFSDKWHPSLIESLLIWTYDESETDKKYLDNIYYAASVVGCIPYSYSPEEVALMNFLLIFKYKKVIKKLLKSNRSDVFKKKIPRSLPEDYNIYNLSDSTWISKFFLAHKKCYDESFIAPYLG